MSPWFCLTQGQVRYALLARLPLTYYPKTIHSFDLHVLSVLLAFILSQGQTLHNSNEKSK